METSKRMETWIYIMVVTLCCVPAVSMMSPCEEARTCRECVTIDPKCTWCTEDEFQGSRCALQSTPTCSEVDKSTLHEKIMTIKRKKPVRARRPVSPQRIDLALRKGASEEITFHVLTRKQAVTLKLHYPRAVDVVVESDCKGFEWKNKHVKCTGVSAGKNEFKLTVKMNKCLAKTKKIKVIVDGNRKRTLKIKLKSVCSCDCEKDVVPDTPLCSSRGNLTCGACSCRSGYYGRSCECDATIPSEEAITNCRQPGATILCSGRGECICGSCYCLAIGADTHRKYSGPYCQCNDYACNYYNGQICGGPERGVCRCGVCECSHSFSGPACEISLSTDNCMSITGEICNNRGTCFSNVCQCEPPYRGKTCEDCPTCPGLCERIKPCVQCIGFGTGPLSEERCLRECEYLTATFVGDIDEDTNSRRCLFRDEDKCLVSFVYRYDDQNRIQTLIKDVKECPRL